METKTVQVPNISCGHCVHTIQNEIADLAGVQSVQADQQSKMVTIRWQPPATWDKIQDTLTEIGYPAAG
jgi:copper chaperone CopZ